MTRRIIASDLARQCHLPVALRMMAAPAIRCELQVMRGPRPQGVRKALRHIFLIVARISIRVLPDAQTAGIVASRAADVRMLRVSRCSAPCSRIVAISAFHRRVVGTMAARTFPSFVRGRDGLLPDHFKPMLLSVAFGAQFGSVADRLVALLRLIPKRERRRVRVADRLMTHIARNAFPILFRYGYTTW